MAITTLTIFLCILSKYFHLIKKYSLKFTMKNSESLKINHFLEESTKVYILKFNQLFEKNRKFTFKTFSYI
jgi:hypothetical protein